MPQLDVSTFLSQLFWLITSFTILYFFLSRFCLPNLSKVFHDRQHKISQSLSKAEKNKEEAGLLKEKYEGIIAQALKTKDSMIFNASKEISNMMERKFIEHELELKILLSASEKKIQEFKGQSSDDIKKIAVDAAQGILFQLLGENTDKDLLLKTLEKQQGSNHV